MNEYIKKIVEEERTGANIVNIKVDTQSRYLFNGDTIQVNQASIPNIPIHKNIMYETLEKMALEIDSYKGKLEQDNLKLALAKEEQEFATKWAGVNDKYNDGKYEEYCKDLNELKKRKVQLISSNKYLTYDEKDSFFKNDEIRNLSIFAGMKNGRNEQVIKQTVDNVNANFEQRIDIMKTTDITNDKEREELMAGMSEGIQMLVDIGYLTQEKAFNKFVEGCASGYMGCINNYTSEVVARYKDNPSVLLNELNKIEKLYLNDKNLSMIAQDVSGRMKSDNEEEGYKYTRALLEESFLKQFKTIKSETRTALKQEQARRRAEERERKNSENIAKLEFSKNEMDAVNESDFRKIYSLEKTGKTDLPSYYINYYDDTVEKYTGKSFDYFGDMANGEYLKSNDSAIMTGIKQQKTLGFYDSQEIAEVYQVDLVHQRVEEQGHGDKNIENNLYKQIGVEMKINPEALKQSKTDKKLANDINKLQEGKVLYNEIKNLQESDKSIIKNLDIIKNGYKYKNLIDKGLNEEVALSIIFKEAQTKNPSVKELKKLTEKAKETKNTISNPEDVKTYKKISTVQTNYRPAPLHLPKQEEKQKAIIDNEQKNRNNIFLTNLKGE